MCGVPVLPSDPFRALLGGLLPGWVGAVLPLMDTVPSFPFTARYMLGAVWELVGHALGSCWALLLPKAVLAARVLAA